MKIVFKLKNFYKDDPVDRLRGTDIMKELKKRGYEVELFNQQDDIDVFVNLDETFLVKGIFDNKEKFKIKKLIFDIQDDHFYFNKMAMNDFNKKYFVEQKANINTLIEKKINDTNIFEKLNEKILNKFLITYRKMLFRYYVRKADYVITSSYALEKISKKFNKNSLCIPDSIDLSLYKEKNNYKTNKVKIVWIGTEGNIPYLLIVNDVLKKLQEKYNIDIWIITSKRIFKNPYTIKYLKGFKFNYKFIEWKLNTFSKYLCESDIGIAPLPNNIAKSSNKILSYMASGLPVVCSNNLDYQFFNNIVFISSNEIEWYKNLEKLILNEDSRKKYGKLGIEKSKEFSLSKIVDKYERLFRSIM